MMGHHFEQHRDSELAVTPDDVWDAIATGPGVDSWFMGRTEVQPGPDGTVSTVFGEYGPDHDITAWEPQARLAYGSHSPSDGRAIAYEFLIEGRSRSSTLVRMVASGFLPGDDWEDEYEAMTLGLDLFWETLVTYLSHFRGRTATPVTVFGPAVDDWHVAWRRLHAALGLEGIVRPGDTVVLESSGAIPAARGVVYAVNAHTIGIRTGDAMYRFLRGFRGPMLACHHLFTDADPSHAEAAWQQWLADVLSPASQEQTP